MTMQYVPGVCNIGPAEIKTRRMTGIFGLLATIFLVVLYILSQIAWPWRLAVFVTATFGAMGFLQAAFHFCVNYASKGLFNMSDSLRATESVDQADYRKKDQAKAVKVICLSVLIGLVVTALVVFLV